MSFMFLASACNHESDFASCEKSSTEPGRVGLMNKCMYGKQYKLNGTAGTDDTFTSLSRNAPSFRSGITGFAKLVLHR